MSVERAKGWLRKCNNELFRNGDVTVRQSLSFHLYGSYSHSQETEFLPSVCVLLM